MLPVSRTEEYNIAELYQSIPNSIYNHILVVLGR